MTATVETSVAPEFLVTKEHRRFAEFAEAVREHRYIGVCYGPPGVGKTVSARRYTHWDRLGPWLEGRSAAPWPTRSRVADATTNRPRPLGPVLISMPGLEKRLARCPQLYSRVGFARQYRPLCADELRLVPAHHWQRLGLKLSLEDFTDAQAVAAISRTTNGNFRLIHRLFAQIIRILEINHLQRITAEVVDAARETLVIGQP